MDKRTKLISFRGKKKDSGYTLLEYCAGAAVIIGVLYGALNTLGGNLSSFLGAIGTWATTRASEFGNGGTGSN